MTRAPASWSGLALATLPGVSLSAGLISTDVPLLFFVALALLALSGCHATALWPALLLGAAFGFGLQAKYAMAGSSCARGLSRLDAGAACAPQGSAASMRRSRSALR